MQRLSLMRIMKRQRMKYEEFESIYPVTCLLYTSDAADE